MIIHRRIAGRAPAFPGAVLGTASWLAALASVGGCELTGPPASPPTVRAGEAAGSPATQPGTGAARAAIIEPSQGRPIILRPGDRFYFLLQLGDGLAGDVYVSLVHSRVPELYFPLALADQVVLQPPRHASLVLSVPREAPEGLYDIRVRGLGETLTARRSVKVVREYRERFRFVHVSDMFIGDPAAPQFDPHLPEEVNLLAPEFVIATGNYTGTAGGAYPWPSVLEYFARFDAPVYMLCGESDDETTFAPTVAASPVGSFDYGSCHGVLLLHCRRRPMDPAQMDYVRRDLAERPESRFIFLAANADDPQVIHALAGDRSPRAFLEAHRIRMLLCGGDSDWDGREHAETLATLPGLQFVRTHPASTTRRGRATGQPHFRVIEVDGEQASFTYPAEGPPSEVQHSIPVGGLGVIVSGEGGDPPTYAAAVVRNGLNQGFADCRVRLRLAKRGQLRPKVAGGRLVNAIDGRSYWLCEISVDVPDRGGLQVAASVDRDPPAAPPVAVEFDADAELTFVRAGAGSPREVSEGRLIVRLRSTAGGPVSLTPRVYLHGQLLKSRIAGQNAGAIELTPDQTVEMPMQLDLTGVTEGLHYVQVCFAEDPLQRLHMHPVVLRRAATTQPAR